jgi:phosphate transport system ATP-binding protein
VGASLSLKQVCIWYGTRRAVDNISLEIPAGEVLALVGPSGSGKTSLLWAINRMHERARVEGQIEVAGQDILKQDPLVLRKTVGMILQKPTPFPVSIRENIAFPLRCHGVLKAEIPGRVESSLKAAALWDEVRDRLEESAGTLSGGQQQRLCLARALALKPTILLLDEPCASLDPGSTALIEQTLNTLSGTTILIVTHNIAQARRLSRSVACLWGGRLLQVGKTEEVFENPATAELGDWLMGRVG